MSFVFDKLNEDDFMLLGSMMLKTRFDKPLKLVYGMKWCRDRIADAYLIDIDGGMCFDPTFFVFYWKGHLMRVEATLTGGKYDEKCDLRWTINRILVPKDIFDKKAKILQLVESAFAVNRNMYSEDMIKSLKVKTECEIELMPDDMKLSFAEQKKSRKDKYDYLIVGAGLYGATFAQRLRAQGKSVLVIDKRPNIAGNVYTEKIEGINVHKYGAHIFHTNNKAVWEYVNRFAEFNRFTNSPVANYKGELYSMPFNMYTFNKMWGVVTPEEAVREIEKQRSEITGEPKNLEEQAISLVGRDIYEKLVKGYTEKQWGRDCKDLPAFIIKRLPVRLTFDNNYFNALYQGIPIGGYTRMVAKMLEGIEVRLNVDYLEHKAELDKMAEKVVYTGAIDAYFRYKLGALEYRSVRFENEVLNKTNFQGNAAVNYTDRETPWTRIIEHKWFEFGKDENGDVLPKTVISREYSSEWKLGDEPYYPVNDEKNSALYAEYKKLAEQEKNIIFGGRLGEYKYYDMDQVIAAALERAGAELL